MADEGAAGLAQAIAAPRSEFATALEEGRGKGLQFLLNEVEIEFQVAVTRVSPQGLDQSRSTVL